MEYWTIIDDRHAGPFSADELIGMGIKPDSPVWTSGLPDWVEASNIEELRVAIERRDAAPCQTPAAEPSAEAPVSEAASAPTPDPAPVNEAVGQPSGPVYVQNPCQPVPPRSEEPRWEWQQEATVPQEPCPPAYLAWSIIVTILCCQVLGIAAIICSAQTKQAYGRGNLAKAKKMSEWAQWLIILSIVLGLISMPFQLALMGI